eukprot:SAG11_NODE_1562_length_4676_cov_2.366616_3_plen_67_part_00
MQARRLARCRNAGHHPARGGFGGGGGGGGGPHVESASPRRGGAKPTKDDVYRAVCGEPMVLVRQHY